MPRARNKRTSEIPIGRNRRKAIVRQNSKQVPFSGFLLVQKVYPNVLLSIVYTDSTMSDFTANPFSDGRGHPFGFVYRKNLSMNVKRFLEIASPCKDALNLA